MNSPTKTISFVVILAAFLNLVYQTDSAAANRSRYSKRSLEAYLEQYAETREELNDQLDKMLSSPENESIREEIEKWKKIPPLSSRLMLKIPKEVTPEPEATLPENEYRARRELQRLLTKHAIDLYKISRYMIKAGYPSQAYFLIREVLRYDSDNKAARRLLGYVRYKDLWVTPFAAQMYRKNYVWHDQFGWLPESRVDEYENGQRYYLGQWMSVAKETAARQDFRRAWEVRTDHFLVKTNHSLEKGVEIATKLEEFYQHFFQIFITFFNSPEQIEKLFASGSRSSSNQLERLHEVHYFRTRDEYNRKLVNKIPQINITDGLYYTTDRTSYFFHDPKQDKTHTLYHEATHQLLYESIDEERRVAYTKDFWLLEGIACYMESFKIEDGEVSLGDPNFNRFMEAGYRFIVNRYYIPLHEFSAIHSEDYKRHPEITKNYSQAAGLVKFFMEYKDGVYRDALIQHLSNIYKGENTRIQYPSLEQLTGVDYRTLDRQYGEFITSEEATLIKGMVEVDPEE